MATGGRERALALAAGPSRQDGPPDREQPSSAGDHVVVARSASKVFPSGDGVHDLDLTIPPGSIFGFVGPSGSGKTTTVRLLTGVAAPSHGTLEVFGKAPSDFDAETRSRLGYMPQLSVLYPNLSVWENLTFAGAQYGMGRRDRARFTDALEFVELDGHQRKLVKQISGGMRRRLSLAATLVHDPELIFLDEPTAGIDPVLRSKFWDRFSELKTEGRTLFVTTQYVGEAAYCDYVGVLVDGRLIMVETPDGLRRAAFGGDIVDVRFVRPPAPDLASELASVVSAVDVETTSPQDIRIIVEEAATALPALGAWLGDRRIEIEQAEEHLPPFDDVFVELIERYRGPEPTTMQPPSRGRLMERAS